LGLYSEKGLAVGKTFLWLLKYLKSKNLHLKIFYLYICASQIQKAMKNIFRVLIFFFAVIISSQQLLASVSDSNRGLSKKNDINKEEGLKENVSLIPLGTSNEMDGEFLESSENVNYFYYAPWTWSESAMELLDKSTAFIFRTKKSSEVDTLRVIVSINDHGKMIGYKVMNEEADKGLIERVGYVLRKMPNAVPVPGFDNYGPMDFELTFGL
jgi:hypothetical protein